MVLELVLERSHRMKRTLDFVDGHYRETMVWIEKGLLHRRQSNSKNRITRDMKSIEQEEIVKCFIEKDDLKIVYASGNTLVLKNYLENAKKYLLFREKITQIQQLPYEIPIIRKDKIKKINQQRIAALAVLGFVLVGSIGAVVSVKGEQPKNDSIEEVKSLPTNMDEFVLQIANPDIVMQTKEMIDQKLVVAESSLEERLQHVQQLQNGEIDNSQLVPIAQRLTDYALNRIIKFLSTEYGNYAYQYGEQFGVDPYLLVAMSMQEASLQPKASGGGAYGLYQINVPREGKEWTVSATNVITGEEETQIVSSQTVHNPEFNTKIAAMMFQNSMRKYHNNIYMAIQSHNFGDGALLFIIDKYADRIGSTREEVMENYEDIGWVEEVKKFASDPHGYITDEDIVKFADKHGAVMKSLRSWPYETYGHGQYIESVLSYYLGTTCQITTEKESIVMDLTDNRTMKVEKKAEHILG